VPGLSARKSIAPKAPPKFFRQKPISPGKKALGNLSLWFEGLCGTRLVRAGRARLWNRTGPPHANNTALGAAQRATRRSRQRQRRWVTLDRQIRGRSMNRRSSWCPFRPAAVVGTRHLAAPTGQFARGIFFPVVQGDVVLRATCMSAGYVV